MPLVLELHRATRAAQQRRASHGQLHRRRSVRFAEAHRRAGDQGRHGEARRPIAALAPKVSSARTISTARPAPAASICGRAVRQRKPGSPRRSSTELTERFGAKPRLTWYDTHVTVDNLDARNPRQRQGAGGSVSRHCEPQPSSARWQAPQAIQMRAEARHQKQVRALRLLRLRASQRGWIASRSLSQ